MYNVNVGDTLTVGEDGLVDVKLSPDSGNLLEARENGLLQHAGYGTAGEFVLRHYGLNVKYNLRPGSVTGLGFYHEELAFEGCVIVLDDTEGIGSAKVIRLRGNRFNNTNRNITNLFISDFSPTMVSKNFVTNV